MAFTHFLLWVRSALLPRDRAAELLLKSTDSFDHTDYRFSTVGDHRSVSGGGKHGRINTGEPSTRDGREFRSIKDGNGPIETGQRHRYNALNLPSLAARWLG